MSTDDSATHERVVTDGSTDLENETCDCESETTGELAHVKSPLDEHEIREVIGHARTLDPEDDRVDTETSLPLDLSQSSLSTLLFESEAYWSIQVPEQKGDFTTGTLTVYLERSSVTFEGHGEGLVHFTVTADPITHNVESLTVSTELTDAGDGRPEGCECGDFQTNTDLPCWPCYRGGFEVPATDD